MTQYARRALEEFARDPLADGESIRKMLAQDNDLIRDLCDPSFLDKTEAINVAKRIVRFHPNLDTKLAKIVPDRESHNLSEAEIAACERALELLEAVSPNHRGVHLLARLKRVENPRLRSKVTLMIGRQIRSERAVEESLQSEDPRVRANSIESLWGETANWARVLLRKAVKDTNNRVAGNALAGLHMLGDETAASSILLMAADSRPAFRATSAWAMGHTGDPQFLVTLEPMTRDLYAAVRKNASKAIERIQECEVKRAAS